MRTERLIQQLSVRRLQLQSALDFVKFSLLNDFFSLMKAFELVSQLWTAHDLVKRQFEIT